MKFIPKNPPRKFPVGSSQTIHMNDCGTLHLDPDEQVTFVTEEGGEYDVARKDWGFYATPSLNGRLLDFNFRSALVKNCLNRFFIMLVEKSKLDEFREYLVLEKLKVVAWLDDEGSLREIEAGLGERFESK